MDLYITYWVKVNFVDYLEVAIWSLNPPETAELIDWIISDYTDKAGRMDFGCRTVVKVYPSFGQKIKKSKITFMGRVRKKHWIARHGINFNQVDITFSSSRYIDTALPDIHGDVLVSNPPYIMQRKNVGGMERNVLIKA